MYAFRLTLERIRALIEDTIGKIEAYQGGGRALELTEMAPPDDLDGDDQNADVFAGKKVRIDLADMDYLSWLHELRLDAENLELLSLLVADISPGHDTKLQTLLQIIRDKQARPVNPGNRKLLIFTAFSDTADYLYQHVSAFAAREYGLQTAEVTGTVDGRTTIPGLRGDLNTVLTCFSPVSKRREVLLPGSDSEIDILIATDCISEGQNLQDCDYLVNYDIHWNPVRIIQRFGRIDRIGSKNARIQLVNFWPDVDLDEYIDLKARVETRMKITVMTSTGDDDLLNAEEKGDLEYRRAQLKRLQEEVVDLEDMSGGVSITDLGLNEFRLDLLEYIRRHGDMEAMPHGLHAVVATTDDLPPGVVFVLKNVHETVNPGGQNRLHPFYHGLHRRGWRGGVRPSFPQGRAGSHASALQGPDRAGSVPLRPPSTAKRRMAAICPRIPRCSPTPLVPSSTSGKKARWTPFCGDGRCPSSKTAPPRWTILN